MKNRSKNKYLRLLRISFLLVAIITAAGLAGCTMLMPREIKDMEKKSQAAAAKLKSERPDAFKDLKAGDRTIHYVEVTDKEPKPLIVFVHGSPGDWSGWVHYLNDPDLQQQAHMIAVDRPGFGGSGKSEVERSLVKQCQEIALVLSNASPGQRIIVVGHSYGGPVVVRLAMDYRDKVTDVVILAGSVDPNQEHTKWYQYVADWPLISSILPAPLVVANREIRALKSELTDMLPLWSNVTQRVSIIQGDKDDLVPPENADFAEKKLSKAESLNMVRLKGVNHFIPWSQYEVVRAEIVKHLK